MEKECDRIASLTSSGTVPVVSIDEAAYVIVTGVHGKRKFCGSSDVTDTE